MKHMQYSFNNGVSQCDVGLGDEIAKFTKASYQGYFTQLLFYMQKITNILIIKKERKIIPMTKEHIAKELKISESTVKRFLIEAKKLKVIDLFQGYEGVQCYIINPAYSFNDMDGLAQITIDIFADDDAFVNFLDKEVIKQFINTYEYKLVGKEAYPYIKKSFPKIVKKFENDRQTKHA